MDVSTVFIFINSLISVFGIIANVILITLILTKTPANIRTYTRLVLCAAICDLTGITMFPLCMPRLHNLPRGMVIIFYGYCNYLQEKLCWASFGITEQLIIVNDVLICLSFVYRLHATTRLPPATYKIFIAVAVVVCFTLTTSVGYYRLLEQARQRCTSGRSYASNTTDKEFVNFTNVPFISGFLDFTFHETPVVLSWTNFGAEVFFGSAILLRFLTARKLKSLQNFMSASTRSSHETLLQSACLQFLLSPIANLVIITPYRRFIVHVFRGGKISQQLAPLMLSSMATSSSVRPAESAANSLHLT